MRRHFGQKANAMDNIPGVTGYMVLNEEGAVINSSGDLQNDEKTADVIMGLINLSSHLDLNKSVTEDSFKKVALKYENHSYTICVSNRKIHIAKRSQSSGESVNAVPA